MKTRHERSEYMHWAKTRQAARFNLAASGLHAVTRAELGVALEDVEIHGPSAYGWEPLLDAIASHLGVPAAHVCHAEGASLANFLALAICLGPGDEVLIEEPGYSLLVDAALFLGAVVRRFSRRREDQFQVDPDILRSALTSRTRLVVLTNLHNPSSARIPDQTLCEIADQVAEAGARLIVDEVYLDATFDPHAQTAQRLRDSIVVTSSLTKVYGVSGLRCGWVVATPDLVDRMRHLVDLLGVAAAHPAERLSLVAFRRLPALRDRARQVLETNRACWNAFLASRNELEAMPLPCGTVAFPRLRGVGVDAFCASLRERYETSVAPGHFFGMADSFRVGLGCPPEMFREGLDRIGLALDAMR